MPISLGHTVCCTQFEKFRAFLTRTEKGPNACCNSLVTSKAVHRVTVYKRCSFIMANKFPKTTGRVEDVCSMARKKEKNAWDDG